MEKPLKNKDGLGPLSHALKKELEVFGSELIAIRDVIR